MVTIDGARLYGSYNRFLVPTEDNQDTSSCLLITEIITQNGEDETTIVLVSESSFTNLSYLAFTPVEFNTFCEQYQYMIVGLYGFGARLLFNKSAEEFGDHVDAAIDLITQAKAGAIENPSHLKLFNALELNAKYQLLDLGFNDVRNCLREFVQNLIYFNMFKLSNDAEIQVFMGAIT